MNESMIDLDVIARHSLATEPYRWAFINGLFSHRGATELVATYPRDHFKTIRGHDGEKGYEYEVRSLVHMGANVPSDADDLSPSWRRLAESLLSARYRDAMTRLTGLDLAAAQMEVNVFHYGPGAWLGPHLDLKEKITTHVLYFNRTWETKEGGCLRILRSRDMADLVTEIAPLVGNSAVLIRSDKSWHAVSRVQEGCRRSRRSVNVIFHLPGSVSTMWPPGAVASLHRYEDRNDWNNTWRQRLYQALSCRKRG
jgi:Rps23 Pro-64 3,4-dihydroxylase Tpa1-like proline 4-hydroxylase